MHLRLSLTQLFLLFCLGILLGAGLVLVASELLPAPATARQAAPEISSIFSPAGEAEILAIISSAESSIDVEMYVFSYQKLADALIEAQTRGVSVRVLMEPTLSGSNPNLETAEYLRDAGVDVRWALPSRTNHAKFAIIDGVLVLVGSHNWSYSAMNRNREASVLVEDAATVREFEAVFEEDWTAAYT